MSFRLCWAGPGRHAEGVSGFDAGQASSSPWTACGHFVALVFLTPAGGGLAGNLETFWVLGPVGAHIVHNEKMLENVYLCGEPSRRVGAMSSRVPL